jgi:3,4-dihydroxy 2-butanone 4-phosphate synthase/GTP cyclohydrolase II
MAVYVNLVQHAEHVALVKGDVTTAEPVLVRMHAFNLLSDVLGDRSDGNGSALHQAMRMIAEAGRGVVVLIREPLPNSLSDRVRARLGETKGPAALRDYGVGAQILLDLGVREMVLLSNSRRTIIGLEGFGLTVVARRPIPPAED